ncbi:unnamed protein product [Discosporangium mesarthrocarpum]
MSLFGTPAPAPAPAPGGFGFGPATPANAPASATFGFSATPAPAPGGTLGFGAAPSTGFGGFGKPAATPAPATAPAFSGFGAPAPAPSTGLFGAAPAPSSTFGSSFGTKPTVGSQSAFGTPATGAFGAPVTGAAGVGGMKGVDPETRYQDLPNNFKAGIDSLFAEIKRQRGLASEVSKTDSRMGLVLQGEMRELRKNLLDLGNMQQAQKLAAEELKGEVRQGVGQAERYGTFLLQQMVTPSGLRTVEELPSQFMWETLARFEKRLRENAQEIEAIRKQLMQAQGLQDGGTLGGAGDLYGGSTYGQRERVTPERLGLIMREQMKTFHHVAGHIASTHEKVEGLRAAHKARYGDDPFEQAERKEREALRRLEKKMRTQAPPPHPPATTLQTQGQQAVVVGPAPQAPATGSAFGGLFGSAPAPTPAPSSSLFGAQAPGTSLFGAAAPAPAPGTSLFGAPATGAPAPAPAGGFSSLFGAAAPAPATTTGGVFGATPAPAPATGGGLFGASGGTGGGLFGSAATASPAPAPAVQFGGTTVFGAPATGGGTFGTGGGGGTSKKKNKSRGKK